MNIKTDLIRQYIGEYIASRIEDFEIDPDQIADTIATLILGEIQDIIKNENYSDFEAIEEIISIFEKYKISFGNRHDF